MSDTIEEKAYDLAYSQLRGQKEDLKNLRNQASFCAVIAGLVASVFASLSKQGAFSSAEFESGSFLSISVGGWLVLFTFSGSIFYAAFTVIGWKTCNFDLNPERFEYAVKNNEQLNGLLLKLSQDANSFFEENEKVLDDTKHNLRMSLFFTLCQIPAWALIIV